MSAPIIAFCNPRRGVGTTTLVYNLAYMFSDLGVPALMVDLDPQVDLSVRFLQADYYPPPGVLPGWTAIYERISGRDSWVTSHGVGPSLTVGNPWLAQYDYRPLPAGADLRRVIEGDAESCDAAVVLCDLAPNLGAFNRAALLASDYLVVPTAAARSAFAGRNLVEDWRKWTPSGSPTAKLLGYVSTGALPDSAEFGHDGLDYLGHIQTYRSLGEMAQEAGKPMFHLTEADGALGSHFAAMQSARKDFQDVAKRIAERIGLRFPQFSGA